MRSVINVMKPAAANSWHILSEAPAFAAPPYLSISRHHVRTDSGVEVPDYWQVKLPDFAIAVALTESEEVITLWQYKHGARALVLPFRLGILKLARRQKPPCDASLLRKPATKRAVPGH
jgi:hypothetical protein